MKHSNFIFCFEVQNLALNIFQLLNFNDDDKKICDNFIFVRKILTDQKSRLFISRNLSQKLKPIRRKLSHQK